VTNRAGYLGIDAGTQGLSVIFTDTDLRILAHGEGRYDMLPGLAPECYEQEPAHWERALAAAMGKLRERLAAAGIGMDVRSIGISGQMHGEVLAAADGRALGPARLWCDGRNEAEGHELTERFGAKCPKRLTAARWLWTIRNRPELAARAARITTPAGWLAFRLTGGWLLGIGDAAGMFPIDQATLDYDRRLLAEFDALVAAGKGPAGQPTGQIVKPLGDMLPTVRRAGMDGGVLDAGGAALMGLPQGIPVAPAEGDQPAALAGSLIARPGMVSVSFGTSVCANSVGDRPFQGVSRAIDHFCAPDGRPINMVFLRNGTTAFNTVVEMFGRAAGVDGSRAFATLLPEAVAAADDCGGLAALPFMDDEPGLGISRGGSASLVGLAAANATPGNAVKAMLLATMFNLRMGSEELDAQGFPRTEIILSGGLTKTPALGQLLADVLHAPVVILDGAAEGTAWGAALLAKYRDHSLTGKHAGGKATDWPAFLEAHASGTPTRFTPRRAAATTLDRAYARHRRLVDLHEALL
jgi:sugar (pentulose or hexulose) kinase